MVADFGEYRSWQYQIGEVEHDEFSHALVFRKSDGKLVSISRKYNRSATSTRSFPRERDHSTGSERPGSPDFAMRVRRLPGGRGADGGRDPRSRANHGPIGLDARI